MREFTGAAKRSGAKEQLVEISINDQVFTAKMPTSGQLALFMARQSDGDPVGIASAIMEMVWAIFDEEQFRVIEGWLAAGELDVEDVMEIIEYLAEEWSDRPTTSVSDSSPSRGSTGKSSTASKPRKATTHSASRSRASSTS